MIDEFRKEYSFLSNFYTVPLVYKGLGYPSAENAFQAQKSTEEYHKFAFTHITPKEAKQLGKRVPLRRDWERIKDTIMYEICKEKFKNKELRKRLLDTGSEPLKEGNYWHDTYWGVSLKTGKGLNKLGNILMQIREEIREGEIT
jgi:hypothetical protein